MHERPFEHLAFLDGAFKFFSRYEKVVNTVFFTGTCSACRHGDGDAQLGVASFQF